MVLLVGVRMCLNISCPNVQSRLMKALSLSLSKLGEHSSLPGRTGITNRAECLALKVTHELIEGYNLNTPVGLHFRDGFAQVCG